MLIHQLILYTLSAISLLCLQFLPFHFLYLQSYKMYHRLFPWFNRDNLSFVIFNPNDFSFSADLLLNSSAFPLPTPSSVIMQIGRAHV